jgi:hypothetical protein
VPYQVPMTNQLEYMTAQVDVCSGESSWVLCPALKLCCFAMDRLSVQATCEMCSLLACCVAQTCDRAAAPHVTLFGRGAALYSTCTA